MKIMIKSLTACVALLLLAGCASTPSNVIPYPSEICIVTDNRLGSMGDPIVKIYGDREIKFCCRPCVKEFEADQQRFIDKLDKPAR